MLRPHKHGDELVRSLGACLSGSSPSRDLTGRSSRIQTASMRRHYLLLALSGFALNCFGQNSSDWSKVAELEKQRQEKPPTGENAVEFYAGRKKALYDAAADFLAKHPDDANAASALLWKIDNTDFSGPAEQRTTLLANLSSEMDTFLKGHPQPKASETEIRETLLSCYLDNDDLIHTPQQAGDLATKIGQFLADYPQAENRVKLQIVQSSLLLKADQSKGIAFLEQLSKDPNPELTEAAKAALSKARLVGAKLDLSFVDSQGQPVDLNQLSGKVVLIDFWASWCPDCVREMPQVQQVYRTFESKGLTILGISLDKDRRAMDNFIAKHLIPWPQYFDGKGWKNDLVTKYSVHEIPEMWIINKKGIVETTSADVTQLASTVERLVAE
jgi:thiol-disulfide isomerase/thioredoxin